MTDVFFTADAVVDEDGRARKIKTVIKLLEAFGFHGFADALALQRIGGIKHEVAAAACADELAGERAAFEGLVVKTVDEAARDGIRKLLFGFPMLAEEIRVFIDIAFAEDFLG